MREDHHGTAPSAVRPATLAEAAALDRRTATSYLDLLEDLRVIERLPAWSTNRMSRLVKTPKHYVTDTGMAAHLAGDDLGGLLRNGDRLGRLIDTFVLAQIRPLLKLASPAVTAFHVRDANQRREVDLALGPTFRRGLVVHTGSMTYPLAERICAVPIAALWR